MQNTEQLQGPKPLPEKRGVPLVMLVEGEEGTVSEIYGGGGLRRRLAEMGFGVGEKIRMLNNHSPGPVAVEVRDAKVCMGRGVAMKIMVEEP